MGMLWEDWLILSAEGQEHLTLTELILKPNLLED